MRASLATPMLTLSLAAALAACGDKGTDSGQGANSSNICIDDDLGSSIDFDLATGSTEGDDYQLSACDGEDLGTDGPDYGWTWTAPATGGYSFTTAGSTFNTVLAIHSGGCTGPLLACNDDMSFDNEASEVYVLLEEGDELVIVVDGYDAYESGSIELHVLQDI